MWDSVGDLWLGYRVGDCVGDSVGDNGGDTWVGKAGAG